MVEGGTGAVALCDVRECGEAARGPRGYRQALATWFRSVPFGRRHGVYLTVIHRFDKFSDGLESIWPDSIGKTAYRSNATALRARKPVTISDRLVSRALHVGRLEAHPNCALKDPVVRILLLDIVRHLLGLIQSIRRAPLLDHFGQAGLERLQMI